MRVEAFASAQDFLARPQADAPSCLVLDLQLPGLSGLDLQKQLAEVNLEIPIVFITGHGNVPASVQAMKAGALEFLTKPFAEEDLLHAIEQAIERDQRARRQHSEMSELRARYESLTPREREVMEQVVSGLLNKQVAAELEDNRVHGEGSSRAGYAKDACRFSGGSRANGREAAGQRREKIVSSGRPATCRRYTKVQ